MYRGEKELYPFFAGPKKQPGRENSYRSGRQVGGLPEAVRSDFNGGERVCPRVFRICGNALLIFKIFITPFVRLPLENVIAGNR